MGEVIAVSARKGHRLSKDPQLSIRLLAGLGVEGDAHCGEKVKHRSRARFNPGLPNLRQVHLIHNELIDELAAKGFAIAPGEMGENILTRGVDLLSLSAGTVLTLGAEATVELTGLRNPCVQLERHKTGLMEAVLDRPPDGQLIRKAGVMAIVLTGGDVRPGDGIMVSAPPDSFTALKPV
jgi:MOSC domain-containing protein YiiM